jgi:hypothetical protein
VRVKVSVLKIEKSCGPDRASSDQEGCLHHTVYIIPLCVYITPSTSHCLHHTVYIIPVALPTGPQPVPVAML